MSDLIATQRAFAAAVRDRAAVVRAAALFAGDDALAERRIAVYRRNAVSAAAQALAAAFPVTAQVVGDEFFEGMARRYWEAHPSTSGDLNDYGAAFATFVAGFAPAAELPYLPDLIRLEWLVHRAYCAADAERLDPAALAQFTADDQPNLSFTFLPGTALLQSDYPIGRIWHLHQNETTGAFELDWSRGDAVLIHRRGYVVEVELIERGAAALYQSLQDGLGLGAAAEAALATQPESDLTQILAHLINHGPLGAVALTPSSLTAP